MSIDQGNEKEYQELATPPPEKGQLAHHHESPVKSLEEKSLSSSAQAQTDIKNADKHEEHEHRSTYGLRLFDSVLFNITNIAVFALSVYSTYMSNFSQPQNTPIDKQNWWMKRGNQVKKFLESKGMSKESAKNANMVLWSFLDGSLMAPVVAMIERRRNKIGHVIDKILGTEPEDTSVYKDQPEEGWKSVILGRLAAFSIVIPTYFLLNVKDKKDPKSLSLNNVLFDKPAEAAVKNNVGGITTWLSKRFNHSQVEGLVNSSIFETFYTTVCTAILFFVSTLTGNRDRDKDEKKAHAALHSPPATPDMITTKEDAQENMAEGKYTNTVGKRNIVPQEKGGSMVERYERDQSAAAQANVATP